jgi:hypothetical protein
VSQQVKESKKYIELTWALTRLPPLLMSTLPPITLSSPTPHPWLTRVERAFLERVVPSSLSNFDG